MVLMRMFLLGKTTPSVPSTSLNRSEARRDGVERDGGGRFRTVERGGLRVACISVVFVCVLSVRPYETSLDAFRELRWHRWSDRSRWH